MVPKLWQSPFGDWVGERSLRAEGVPEGMLDCSEVIMLT